MISPAPGYAPDDQPSFLATIGHELRNPLSCILAQAETLQDGLHGPVSATQQAVLQSIQEEVHRTLSLVSDLADLGRIEANALVLNIAPCSLETVQRQVLEVAHSTAQARSVQLMSTPAPAGVQVQADETRLRQIIFELVSAVLLSSPVGGQATVCITQAEGGILIQAGSGISAEHLCSLPFPPRDDSTSPAVISRLLSLKPLGISLLRKLVQLQGGTFSARAFSRGAACLSVYLPLSSATTAAAAAAASPAPAPAESAAAMSSPTPAPGTVLDRAPIILLADDQPSLVTVTTHYLENLGFQVHAARDGQEAIEKVRTLKPDLVLMDVRMPVLEGPQAIQAIRASEDPALRAIPIISLSGQPGPVDHDRCMAAGASAHLSKPFGVKELDAAIRRFVTAPG
ncbi:MAG: hybrid sensor histidine kinase/response regulator [Prosthecobacter sp.]